MLILPNPYSQEFRDDVGAAARKHEGPLKQIAKGLRDLPEVYRP